MVFTEKKQAIFFFTLFVGMLLVSNTEWFIYDSGVSKIEITTDTETDGEAEDTEKEVEDTAKIIVHHGYQIGQDQVSISLSMRDPSFFTIAKDIDLPPPEKS